MHRQLLLILLCTIIAYLSLSAQDHALIALKDFKAASFSDIREYLTDAWVIGAGESTHGTHEFFHSRTQLFQYLVKEMDFTTFYLEADYTNCLPIDAYIKGGAGSADSLVYDIGLWPWMTQEMVDLVEWMRSYNTRNPDQPLSFIGVDVQKLKETTRALLQLLGSEAPKALLEVNPITNETFYSMKPRATGKLFQPAIDALESLEPQSLSSEETNAYEMLVRHFKQVVQVQASKNKAMRDILMAENILHYTQEGTRKGLFWAHNVHIAKWYFPKKEKGVAGGVLKHRIGGRYFSLGQEFCEGSFNVFHQTQSGNKQDRSNYEQGPVTVGAPDPSSMAGSYLNDYQLPLFIPFAGLPEGQEVRMTSIGARYVPSEDPKSIWRYNHHGHNAFDALILIDQSTPTELLER